MDQFLSTLRERGVPEKNLTKMAEDKVDQDVVRLLDEEELSVYIPQYGDRVFAKNWRNSSSAEAEDTEQRKRKLINRLREKMKLSSTASSAGTRNSQSRPRLGNKNAERQTRKIELGWLNYQDSVYKQVRRPTGGGTREMIVRKDDLVSSLLEKGKKLFFPNGNSKKGKLEDFEFMLSLMGSEEPLEGNVTIGRLYEQTNHKVLRIYFCTKAKDCSDSEPGNITDEPLWPHTSSHAEASSSSSLVCASSPMTEPCSNSENASNPQTPVLPQSLQLLIGDDDEDDDDDDDDEIVFLMSDTNLPSDDLADRLVYSPQQVSNDQSSTVVTTEGSDSPQPTVTAVMAENEDIDPMIDFEQVSSTQAARVFFENPENIAEKQTIVIRQVHCVMDMVEAFANENILDANISFRRVLENGEVEAGVGSGIIRDILTNFWNLFYATKTCGTTYKIPALHHSFQEREWAAVARVLAFGWHKFQYLPVQLAPPFLTQALSLSTSENNLVQAFFNFISPTEKDVLTEALDNFTMANEEELFSILSSHNCTLLPTEGNLSKLVEEIAYKEMVQEPAFIIKCWQPILRSVGESLSCDGLKKILDDLKPRARNITKCIQFPGCMSDAETITSNQLLRFVRERDEKELGLFLRYCTGSDLFLGQTIKVTVSDMSEFTRCPVAHTCSCLLELPCNYSNYTEFKSEFCSVLQSGVWVMDMS
ncbi:uncharacterized protein LOC115786048 isoform X2 [Archocentrus centrarchus]|nr:uncharacterized protein LOC115786048 isoform X2 [Archocentrus centrarchus]